MHSLPKLPGLDFEKKNQQHHVSHSFEFKNGYRIPQPVLFGIGRSPLKNESSAFKKTSQDPIMFDPILTYGRVKRTQVDPFQPHFVLYDKKSLKFKAFFKQEIFESQNEHFRTRFVNIFYFLEDDTIVVIEPEVDNCGFPQGKLVRRGKITKNTAGQYYTWKDFNTGIDIEMQGIVFHIADCDEYTKEFLLSNGIELNNVECLPVDSVNATRQNQAVRVFSSSKPTITDDKLRRYLKYQGMVLQFDCVLNEPENSIRELMTYKLFYYLEDDSIAIKELKENREGRYHFPMMMSRHKLPKIRKHKPSEFPSIFMEKTTGEAENFYGAYDLRIGEIIYVYSRNFLLLDCDKFTRNYYEHIMKPPMPQPDKLTIPSPEKHRPKMSLPIYLGLGTPEDSMASCYSLIPKTPRKDNINSLINQNKFLRYGCMLDSAYDQHRKFILMYSLAEHTIQIVELESENSGIQGGRFLSPTKLIRPDSDPNSPMYYTAADIFIGATIHVFSHRFKITSADLYVYNYMQNYPEKFNPISIQSVRSHLLLEGHIKGDLEGIIEKQVLPAKDNEPVSEHNCMEEVLQNLESDLQFKNNSEASNTVINTDDERGVCPYNIVPEEHKRKSYHETTDRKKLEKPKQRQISFSDAKLVHFDDEIITHK